MQVSSVAPPAVGALGGVSADSAPPQQKVETGHTDTVHDAQLDFYGRRLATCAGDRTIRVFDVDGSGQRTLQAKLEGHDGPVWQVAWAHPTRHGRPILASCGFDGRVIVWIEDTPGMWRQYYDYSWHASSVNSVCFAPHEYGLIFACASSDGFVSICTQLSDGTWDERRVSESRDGGAHTHPLGANSVSWAPAIAPGGLWMPEMAAPPPKRIVTAGCDQMVKIWRCDDQTGNWVMDGSPLTGHREMVRGVAWAPSIGLPRAIIASAGQDKRVIVWSQDHPTSPTSPSSGEWVKTELPPFSGPVWSVSWSPTGSALGVASGDDSITIWKEELDGTWRSISDVGQPLEVLKTQVAANRNQSLFTACAKIYARGGVRGFWQGLYPWALFEAVTKGGVLLLTQSEIQSIAVNGLGTSPQVGSALGGICGGVAQAYTTMGLCTFMKTVEVTRAKGPGGKSAESTIAVARRIFGAEGVRGMYKGVSAVALRQASNWGSRFGFSRVVEGALRGQDKERPLAKSERLAASVLGGGLAVWNHPFEVCRVEMQSMVEAPDRPKNLTVFSTGKYIYARDGLRGLYRGVVPRIGLSAYLTVVMVYGGDEVRNYIGQRSR